MRTIKSEAESNIYFLYYSFGEINKLLNKFSIYFQNIKRYVDDDACVDN